MAAEPFVAPGASTSSCSDSRATAAPPFVVACVSSCACARYRRADAAKEARGSFFALRTSGSTRDRCSSRVGGVKVLSRSYDGADGREGRKNHAEVRLGVERVLQLCAVDAAVRDAVDATV